MRLVKRFLPIFLMMGSGSLIERTVKYDGGTLEVYDSKIKTNFELNLNPKPHIKWLSYYHSIALPTELPIANFLL